MAIVKPRLEGLQQRSQKSRASAIKLFCVQCMGGDVRHSMANDIRACTATDCALHCWRPYK